MTDYRYTLKLEVKGQTAGDLIRTMDEIKEQIAYGYGMAYEEDKDRRYALSLDDNEL